MSKELASLISNLKIRGVMIIQFSAATPDFSGSLQFIYRVSGLTLLFARNFLHDKNAFRPLLPPPIANIPATAFSL